MKKYSDKMRNESEGFNNYLNKVISHIHIEGVENLEVGKNGGATVVCTHRSHLDYVIIGMRFSRLDFHHMRFAAGDNLTRIPILGKKFIDMGSFSVFRGKASQRTYLFKLADQVKKMIIKGDNIIVFPEGGRSYTGRMLEVKGGIVGATVMAQQQEPSTDRYYIPIAISYNGVPDVKAIPLLNRGKKLRGSKNKITKMIGNIYYYAADILCYTSIWLFPDKNFRAYVDIGTPIKVNDITDVEGQYNEKSKNQFFANGRAIKDVTEKIQSSLLEYYRVLPHNLVAYILSSSKVVDNNGSQLVLELLEKMSSIKYNDKEITILTVEEIWEEGAKRLKKTKGAKGSIKKLSIKNYEIISYESGIIRDLFGEEA